MKAILTRGVERGESVVRGMTEAEFDALPKDQQMEVLIENRAEVLSPEARRRLLPNPPSFSRLQLCPGGSHSAPGILSGRRQGRYGFRRQSSSGTINTV